MAVSNPNNTRKVIVDSARRHVDDVRYGSVYDKNKIVMLPMGLDVESADDIRLRTDGVFIRTVGADGSGDYGPWVTLTYDDLIEAIRMIGEIVDAHS